MNDTVGVIGLTRTTGRTKTKPQIANEFLLLTECCWTPPVHHTYAVLLCTILTTRQSMRRKAITYD